MIENAIILAFWQPKQQRFVELTADELITRSGFGPDQWEVVSAIRDGYVMSEPLTRKGVLIYGLTYRGKQTAKHILEKPTVTKYRRLTAIPPKEMRK